MHSTRTRSRFRLGYAGVALACAVTAACGWNPSRPFEREAPPVREAISALDAGDASGATMTLEEYLSTGACKEGNIGVPERLKARPDGTFDLGLALFRIAESHGRRFGEEELDAGGDPTAKGLRSENIGCALRVVRAVAEDPKQPGELRARARYLEGNLLFLDAAYEDAVKAYDHALAIIPGLPEAGAEGGPTTTDTIGQDAAFNRAIALRRIEDKKDAGNDASSDGGDPDASSQDGGGDGGSDGGGDSGGKGGSDGGGGQDAGADARGDDAGGDKGQKPDPPPEAQDASAPPPQQSSQDDRILDQLENAPTVQQETAKKHAGKIRGKGLVDK